MVPISLLDCQRILGFVFKTMPRQWVSNYLHSLAKLHCLKLTAVRYVIVTLDCTVFPANSTYLAASLKTFSTLLSMSSTMIGLVFYPVFQTQTSESALVKHRQQLDNALLKGGLSVIHAIQILYEKPDSTAMDRRGLYQLALASFHTHYSSHSFHQCSPVREGKLGPAPLLKVSDFLGYDSDTKPGASARVEQCSDVCFSNGFAYMLWRFFFVFFATFWDFFLGFLLFCFFFCFFCFSVFFSFCFFTFSAFFAFCFFCLLSSFFFFFCFFAFLFFFLLFCFLFFTFSVYFSFSAFFLLFCFAALFFCFTFCFSIFIYTFYVFCFSVFFCLLVVSALFFYFCFFFRLLCFFRLRM